MKTMSFWLQYCGSKSKYKSTKTSQYWGEWMKAFYTCFCPLYSIEEIHEDTLTLLLNGAVLTYPKKKLEKVIHL